MIILYAISLAFSIWCAATNDSSSFWFAWGIAWAVVNAVLVIGEISR